MSVSLKVKPIKEPAGAQHPDPRHSVLPTHEFSMLIIAPRGSGKTTLILNLISDFYRGYFHSIKVFSPTMAGDAKWETIRKMRGILAENRHHKELETKSAKGKGGASKGASSSESESEEEEDRAPGHQYSYKTAWHSLFASPPGSPPGPLPHQIDGFDIELPPGQNMLLFNNYDKPGALLKVRTAPF